MLKWQVTIVDIYVLFVIADLRVANIYLEKALIKRKILVATAFTDPGIECLALAWELGIATLGPSVVRISFNINKTMPYGENGVSQQQKTPASIAHNTQCCKQQQ